MLAEKREEEFVEQHKEQEKVHLSDLLKSIFDESRESVSFQTLFEELEHHGLAILMILFSLWSALPIPAAGYSTLLSIPLFYIGYCFIRGKETINLPEKIAKQTFQPAKLGKIKKLLDKIVGFLEIWSKPRLTYLVQSRMMHIGIGFLIFMLAASMALPIPGTNTLPAGGIFLIGFAFLEDDGLVLLGGLLYSLVALALTVTIIFLGKEAVVFAIDAVKSYFL